MSKQKNSRTASGRYDRRHLRYVITALCMALLVVANMVIIFRFSSESREGSGDRSAGVTQTIVGLVHPDLEELSLEDQQAVLDRAHGFVRKAAHFSEYALLGFLTAGLLLFLRRFLLLHIQVWHTWICPAVLCLLYAISDEIHQIFSNRGPSVWDVMIDFSGAVCGVCVMQLTVWVIRRVRTALRKRRERRRIGKEALCEPPATV